MNGKRVAPIAPARWVLLSLIAVVAAAAVVQFVDFVWLTAPAAGALVWIGGSAFASLLLGDHRRGRVFHAVLGLVLGVVVMLIVALSLHYLGRDINQSSVVQTMSVLCIGLVLSVVVFRREAIGVGFLPAAEVVAASVAASVLLAAGGIAVAIQERPTERFELLTFTDPAVASSIEERQVDAGSQVFVSFELHSFGYQINQAPWAEFQLGDQRVNDVDIISVPTSGGSQSGYRGTAKIRAPETAGASRIELTVRFIGPTGDPLERQVQVTVFVR